MDLPTGTLKRVVIPVFTAAQSWNARLLDERGRIRAEQSSLMSKVISHELPLVVGLCRTAAGLPSFPEFAKSARLQSSSYGAARLQTETFPDNPLAMESIDLLYLNSTKALDLNEQQVHALLAWLQNGGHLVVGVEQISDLTANRWLRDLMPCDLTQTRSLENHPQLDQWVRSSWINTRYQEPNLPNNAHPRAAGRSGPVQTMPTPALPMRGRGNPGGEPAISSPVQPPRRPPV